MPIRVHLPRLCSTWAMTLLFMGLPWAAIAADGVLEINQTCAVQTGCFAGDTPGFPVTITLPGSYQLTGNLDVSSEGTGLGIQITADASLDLNGFGIRASGAAAIRALAPSEIRNGFAVHAFLGDLGGGALIDLVSDSSVRDLYVKYHPEVGGGFALQCGDRCLIENVRVDSGENSALGCGNECIISNGTVSSAGGGHALNCGEGCVLEMISVQIGGIFAGNRTQLRKSDMSGQHFQGSRPLILGDQSIIDGCTISVDSGSLDSPVTCGDGCNVSKSTFSGVASGADGPLLIVGTGSMIRGNTFRNSPEFAFEATGEVGYSGNVITDNNGGNANPQVQGGTDLGGNLCGTRMTCP